MTARRAGTRTSAAHESHRVHELKGRAVLVKVITRKGEEDEYPCFVIGRPRAAKFDGNGIH